MSAQMADAGLKAIMGISAGVTARANVQAGNIVNSANAYAANTVRAANNELTSKRSSLARFTQSVNNQRVLDNAGDQLAAAQTNYRRARDSEAQDDFETQLRFAEQAGAQSAASALAGVVGGVADIVNSTTALRKSRLQQRQADALAAGDFDAGQRFSQIQQAGWDSLDSSEITDALDYSKNVAVNQVYGGNLLSEVWSGQSSQSLANVTSAAGESWGNWRTSQTYGTKSGSQQTNMLREQDSWF